MRGIMGGLAGGFLGSMLFSSLGWGAGGGWGGGGGIGFLEILIFAALLFFLFRWMKRRRQQAYASSQYQESAQPIGPSYQPSYQSSYDAAPAEADLDKGLRYIRQIDPQFDEQQFRDRCMDQFFKIQGAWQVREITPVRNLLTQQMYDVINTDAEKLRAERKINKLENIAVRTVDITEAWQEQGVDYITVRFYANLLDYVVDESTGQVVSGNKIDPVKFEEYWTFARNVGTNSWQLSAITQPN
jgi:predicted lipid-binding transport protein (Tim44 family)